MTNDKTVWMIQINIRGVSELQATEIADLLLTYAERNVKKKFPTLDVVDWDVEGPL